MKVRFIVLLVILFSVLGVASLQVAAQDLDDPAACFTVIEQAFADIGTFCANNALDTACYGHVDLSGVFAQEVEPDFFTEPGDVASLDVLETLAANPIDLEAETWGLGVINSQASLPTELIEGPLGGKGVIFIVPGGINVSDDTADTNTIVPLSAGIAVTTTAAADLRLSPVVQDTATWTNVAATVPANTTVSADAISEDGDWVRVVYNNRPGWISSAVLPSSADLSSLVEVGPENFTPMQAISLEMDENPNPACNSALNSVIAQGPRDIPVDVQVQGVPVRIGSTALFRLINICTLRITAVSGLVTLFPDNPALRLLVPPGFHAEFNFCTGQYVTRNPLPGSQLRPLSPFEATWWNFISRLLPDNIIYYLPGIIIVSEPSGVGSPLPFIDVQNDRDLELAREACSRGEIAPSVCAALGL